jgi:hypothetical protein
MDSTDYAPGVAMILIATGVQDGLGVTVRLQMTLEHQVTGRRKGNTVLEVVAHRPVRTITDVLVIHYPRHTAQRLIDLRPSADAVPRPVSQLLTRDARRGAV